jgi:hypothetical protein
MPVTASLVSPEMHAAVGTELWRLVSFPISESDIRRWAVAIYYPEPPPHGFSGERIVVAPEDFNPFAWAVADGLRSAGGPNYIEDAAGIPGPDLRHSVYGGLEVSYGVRMRPGDVITSLTTLAGYEQREGRRGPLLLTTLESHWANDRGVRVKLFRSTVIRYRG